MTNTPVGSPLPPTSRPLRLPAVAIGLFILSPLLMIFGGLTVLGTAQATYDLAKMPTMVGTVMFWVGVAALMTALVLAGARAIAQQQMERLQGIDPR